MSTSKTTLGKGQVTSSKSPVSATITKIEVNLSRQKLLAYAGTVLVYEFDCVIGRAGHVTSPGQYRIFKKEAMHLSHAYGNTPMPFSMFFSPDGKAIHATPAAKIRSYAGYLGLGGVIPIVGSHGCVGLDEADAQALYGRTPANTVVEIVK